MDVSRVRNRPVMITRGILTGARRLRVIGAVKAPGRRGGFGIPKVLHLFGIGPGEIPARGEGKRTLTAAVFIKVMAAVCGAIRAYASANGNHLRKGQILQGLKMVHGRFGIQQPPLAVKGLAAALTPPKGEGENMKRNPFRHLGKPVGHQPGRRVIGDLRRKVAVLQPGGDRRPIPLISRRPVHQHHQGRVQRCRRVKHPLQFRSVAGGDRLGDGIGRQRGFCDNFGRRGGNWRGRGRFGGLGGRQRVACTAGLSSPSAGAC